MNLEILCFDDFRQEMKKRLNAYLPVEMESWSMDCYTHYKVNEKLEAITVKPPGEKGEKAYPVFYMEDLYAMYLDVKDLGVILRHVASWIAQTPSAKEIKSAGFSVDNFRGNIVFELINRRENRELLKTLPHRKFLDLAVIYRVLVFDKNGEWGGMLVNQSLMERWNMTENDLYETAWTYTRQALPCLLMDTGSMLREELTDEEIQIYEETGKEQRMYVLGNESMQFGAAAMLYPDMLERAADLLEGDFYILPGSIHELYLVAAEENRLMSWDIVVRYANRELVQRKEWLSDRIYRYDAKQKKVKYAAGSAKAGSKDKN